MFEMNEFAVTKLLCPVGHFLRHDVSVDVNLHEDGNADFYDDEDELSFLNSTEKTFLLNSAFFPKFRRIPTSISVARK